MRDTVLQDIHTGANTNVDVLFRAPKLPSLRSKKGSTDPAEEGLMEVSTSSSLDDSAMVTDISGEALEDPLLGP